MYKYFLFFILNFLFYDVGYAIKTGNETKLYPVLVNGKWGFIDNTGKIKVTPRYEAVDKIYGFREGMIGVKENGKWGFMNNEGKLVIEPQFDGVNTFHEGMAGFEKKSNKDFSSFYDDKGFINRSGQIVIPPIYQDEFSLYGDFKEGVCVVKKDYKYGYVNKSGKEIIPLKYALTTSFDKGVAAIEDKDSIYWVIDMNGRKISEGFKVMTNFSNSIALATSQSGKKGFVNSKGVFKEVTDYDLYYFFTFNCSEGILIATTNHKYGLMDIQGKLLSKLIYDEITAYHEGLVAVSLDGKKVDSGKITEHFEGGWGFLDTKGKVAVPLKFQNVLYFSDGLAQAQEGGKWGYIDTKGNWVLKPVFDEFQGDFINGIARVEIKTSNKYDAQVKYGYIDKTGKYIWEPQL